MDKMILGLFGVVCFYIGYIYLFNHERAFQWDNSQRLFRGVSKTRQDEAWQRRARRGGVSAILGGVFLRGMVAGGL
jgi:hypothetical protein